MKPLLLTLALATGVVGTAQAEYYRSSVVRDTTLVGAVAGALVGGHNGDRWVEGGLIGAAAGAIVGTIVDQPRRVERVNVIQPVAVVPYAPTVVTAPAPQVVYVESRPVTRVVYVESHRRPVVISRPVVYVGRGYGHHHGHGHRHGHRGHRHGRR